MGSMDVDESDDVAPGPRLVRLAKRSNISYASIHRLMETNPYRPSEITEPAPDHFRRSPLPVALKVVAGLWILMGLHSLVRMILSMMSGSLMFDITVLGIAIGIGLLVRSTGARICAIICHFIGKLLSVLVVVVILFEILRKQGADVSAISGILLVVLSFLLLRWMDRVLRRDDVMILFGIKKPKEVGGDGIPAE